MTDCIPALLRALLLEVSVSPETGLRFGLPAEALEQWLHRIADHLASCACAMLRKDSSAALPRDDCRQASEAASALKACPCPAGVAKSVEPADWQAASRNSSVVSAGEIRFLLNGCEGAPHEKNARGHVWKRRNEGKRHRSGPFPPGRAVRTA